MSNSNTSDESMAEENRANLRALAEEALNAEELLDERIPDAVAGWIASQYINTAHRLLKAVGPDDEKRMKLLCEIGRDWDRFRRTDHSRDRARVNRERLDWAQIQDNERRQEKIRASVARAAMFPEFFPGGMGMPEAKKGSGETIDPTKSR